MGFGQMVDGQYCRTHSNHRSCAAYHHLSITISYLIIIIIKWIHSYVIIIITVIAAMSQLIQEQQEQPKQILNTSSSMEKQLQLSHMHNPTPLRIHADNTNPQSILFFWLVFAISVTICVLIANFLAPTQVIRKNNQTELKNTVDHKCMNPCGFENQVLICNPFGENNPDLGLLMRDINALNEFALVYLQLRHQNQTNSNFYANTETRRDTNTSQSTDNSSLSQSHNISQTLNITLYSMKLVKQNGVGRFVKKQQLAYRTLQLEDEHENETFTFYSEQIRHLIGFFRQQTLGLQKENFLLVIHFSNVSQVLSKGYRPVLKSILMNPNYIIFTMVIRICCLVITILTGIVYIRQYFKIVPQQRIIQQKLVLVLSIFIIFFNDPFYPLSVLKMSPISVVFSVLFFTSFIAYLMFFWVFLAIRIYKEEYQKELLGLKQKGVSRATKVIYFLYFLCYFIAVSWYYQKVQMSKYTGNFILHPNQIFTDSSISSTSLTITFELLLVANLAGFLTLSIMSITQKYETLLWRYRTWLYFNVYFVLVLFVYLQISAIILEADAKLTLIFYVSINLYCIFMQYMWSPARDQVRVFRTQKDSQEMQNYGILVPVQPSDLIKYHEGTGGQGSVEIDFTGQSAKKHPSYQI